MAAVPSCDVVVAGGGIVGCATALALTASRPGLKLMLLEKEPRLAAHQTGHNSGVIHAGLYYRPGSLKARNCTAGREALYAFCAEHGIPFQRCGKVVVAVGEDELPALEELERRGRANGLEGLERLDAAGVRAREPHAAAVAGLFVPQTGIVDYARVTAVMGDLLRRQGAEIRLGTRLDAARPSPDGVRLATSAGEVRARILVNCTGLHCDRVARRCGVDPGVRIVPFRGEYYLVRPERRELVRHLIYPVPDPALPFLGVHFTRMIDGSLEAGPNAVLAWKREGYRWHDVSPGDLLDTLAFPGFWRLAGRFWKVGAAEYRRSFSRRAFVASLRRLVPEIGLADVLRGGAGVRAQAVDRDGKLVDDFRIIAAGRMVHVLNAPSPAATASLSIGRVVAGEVGRLLDA
ncbi:MAG: L-2-hydroxyglutarate oxidase [Deltaproteobacteria bacterium]|nr:MAG: L-2-hydroxyglutarate oxidase [Deltaproteobacteria bacterium]